MVSPPHRLGGEGTMNRHLEYIRAMLATHIPVQGRGLWYITRLDFTELTTHPLVLQFHKMKGAYHDYPALAPVMTSLCRWTDATIHQGHGESVMSDDPLELRKHLPVVLHGRGRVLVSGLGLGCVVRGLLANPAVEHVDVVEIDADVLAMVQPTFAPDPRLTIHHDDALTMRWPPGTRWSFIWHDVWGDSPGTQVLHAKLLMRYRGMGLQGAWGFPRFLKRQWPDVLVGGPVKGTTRDRRTRGDSQACR